LDTSAGAGQLLPGTVLFSGIHQLFVDHLCTGVAHVGLSEGGIDNWVGGCLAGWAYLKELGWIEGNMQQNNKSTQCIESTLG